MENLIARVATATDLSPDVARKAVALIGDFIQREAPEEAVQELFKKAPAFPAIIASSTQTGGEGMGVGLKGLMGVSSGAMGGGGLMAFPVASEIDEEVWVRSLLREPGQGWSAPVDILPPETGISSAVETAATGWRSVTVMTRPRGQDRWAVAEATAGIASTRASVSVRRSRNAARCSGVE